MNTLDSLVDFSTLIINSKDAKNTQRNLSIPTTAFELANEDPNRAFPEAKYAYNAAVATDWTNEKIWAQNSMPSQPAFPGAFYQFYNNALERHSMLFDLENHTPLEQYPNQPSEGYQRPVADQNKGFDHRYVPHQTSLYNFESPILPMKESWAPRQHVYDSHTRNEEIQFPLLGEELTYEPPPHRSLQIPQFHSFHVTTEYNSTSSNEYCGNGELLHNHQLHGIADQWTTVDLEREHLGLTKPPFHENSAMGVENGCNQFYNQANCYLRQS
ncbi:hypothetical protein GQ44DRAFT_769101 [Phaeosphaeriaceae sp. PMI808]|nr:hypothetical protein GQ44DRAFT_769101 [Phaeosphaeriaceae sp. PMI808]